MSSKTSTTSGTAPLSPNAEYFKETVSIMRYLGILLLFISLILGGTAYFEYIPTGRSYLAFGSLLLIAEVFHIIYFGFSIDKMIRFDKAELVFNIVEALFFLAFIISECVFTGRYALYISGESIGCVILGFIYTLLKIVMFYFVYKEGKLSQIIQPQSSQP